MIDKYATQLLDYVDESSKTIGLALKIASSLEAKQAQASGKVPQLVEKLKKAGLIDSTELKTASDQLGDHTQALEILANVIDHLTTKTASDKRTEPGTAGSPEEKRTSRRKYANYCGYRRGDSDEPRESDLVFEARLLGHALPSEN